MSAGSISIDSEPERGFVRIQVAGELEFEAAERAHAEATRLHPRWNRLWDFREADLTGWSADDMRGFAEKLSAREQNPASVRVAAVVSREVDYGLARMYEIVSQRSLPARYAVFRNVHDAESWVSMSDPEPT